MGLHGMALQLAQCCVVAAADDRAITLEISESARHLLTDSQQTALTAALRQRLGDHLQVRIQLAAGEVDSRAERDKQKVRQQQVDAEGMIHNDPVINEIIEAFDARVVDGTVKPTDNPTRH